MSEPQRSTASPHVVRELPPSAPPNEVVRPPNASSFAASGTRVGPAFHDAMTITRVRSAEPVSCLPAGDMANSQLTGLPLATTSCLPSAPLGARAPSGAMHSNQNPEPLPTVASASPESSPSVDSSEHLTPDVPKTGPTGSDPSERDSRERWLERLLEFNLAGWLLHVIEPDVIRLSIAVMPCHPLLEIARVSMVLALLHIAATRWIKPVADFLVQEVSGLLS